MAITELDVPDAVLNSARLAAHSAGITWRDFLRQALEHETALVHQEQHLTDEATIAYERTCAKYSSALKELAK